MSRWFAQAAVAVLKSDSIVSGWATGGILDRDPRRSGPNATDDAFTTTPDREIKPVIGVVGTSGTPAFSSVPNANLDTFEVRLFAPDYHKNLNDMDAIANRIIALLNRSTVGGDRPGIIQYEFRLGIQNGGDFKDVSFDIIRFNVSSVYARLEVAG